MGISRRAVWIAIAFAVACGVLLRLAFSDRPTTPEERIRAMLEQAARAAEKRDVADVVEILSDRFRARNADWRASRDEIRRMLAAELFRGQWVSVSISSAEVVVDGARAKAHVDAVLSRAADRAKGLSALLPGEASVHRFQLDLEEEEGKWRVVSGAWRQISLEEALSGPGAPDW